MTTVTLRRRVGARRGISIGVSMTLFALALASAPGAAAAPPARIEDATALSGLLIRSTATVEIGVSQPTALAYSAAEQALVIAGTDADGNPAIVRSSLAQEALGAPEGLAADASMLVVDPNTGQVTTVDAGTAVDDPGGAALDAHGRLLVLDSHEPSIVRFDGGSPVGEPTQIAVGVLGTTRPSAIAVNPDDGLAYLSIPGEQLVYGVDESGAVRTTINVSEAGLANIAGLAFAPSADPTDDPATTNLYLVDSGTTDRNGQLVEMRIAPAGNASTSTFSAAETTFTAAALTNETAVLVRTIETSQWSPPSPDPCSLVWLPHLGRFIVSDSEVEEMSIWAGANLFEMTTSGALVRTASTTAYSNEPTGVAYRASDNTLLVSDDNANRVTFVNGGPDGLFGTADDTRTFLNVLPQSDDAEDVAYDPTTGHVFVIDGVAAEVFRFNPGPNGVFGDADDIRSNFDVGAFGARDPEGIDYNPANDSLLVLDQRSRMIYEVSKDGALLRTIDIRAANSVAASGIAIAPGSIHPDRMNLYVADRMVDNGPDPNENDGRIYELSIGSSSNTAPVVNAVTIDQSAPRTNDTLTVSVTASDADGDPLEYRYVWRKNGVQIPGQTSATLDLSVAGNGDKGDAISVRVVAFDGIVESAPRTSSQVTIVNSPPAFNQDLGNRSDPEGAVISLSAGATDADGDVLTYAATGLPSGLSINTASGLISGTIAAGAAGSHNVAVTVREGAVVDATDTFTWTVTSTPVNSPPTIQSVTIDQSAPRTNDTLTVTVSASDPDGDALTYAYQWTKNGANLANQTNATLNLSVAGNGDKGDSIAVRVTASDPTSSSAPVTSTAVTVADTPPAFNQDLGNRSDPEGAVISLSAAATDADGDALTYEATGLPTGLSINAATGLVTGTIAAGAAAQSPYNTSITVRQGANPDATDTFTWTVTAPAQPPPAPTGLTNAVSSIGIDLDWADSAGVAGYHVYRSASSTGPFTRLNAALLTVSAYNDRTMPIGTSFYRVTAVSSAGLESTPAETSATMLVQFVQAVTGTAKDTTSVTVARPAATAPGDLLLASVAVGGAGATTAPVGWVPVVQTANGTVMRQILYSKVATTAEPTSYTWSFAKSSASAVITAYRGATAVEAAGGRANPASRSITAPSVTALTQGAIVVGFFGAATNASITPPTGMLEQAEATQTAGKVKNTVETSDSVVGTAGATGDRIASANQNAANIGQLVVIRP